MAFESLSDKFQNIFKNMRRKGRLTEEDVKAALKEVKMALLEADVSFKVVKTLMKSIQEKAIGQDVMNGLNPGQMVIKIVNDEMTAHAATIRCKSLLSDTSAIPNSTKRSAIRHEPWKYGMTMTRMHVKSATVPAESGSSFLGSHALRENRIALTAPVKEPALMAEMQSLLTNGMKSMTQTSVTAIPSIR